MKTPKLKPLDPSTIQTLLKEAKKTQKRAEKLFEEYDDSELMAESDAWSVIVEWLEEKLKALE